MRDAWRRAAVGSILAMAAASAASCGGGPSGATGGGGSTGTGGAGVTGSGGAAGNAGSGGVSGDGGQADEPPPVDDPFALFCAAARAELINRYARCTLFTVEGSKTLARRDPCLWWGAAVSGNRMAFDATDADACIAALRTAPCDADTLPAVCDGVLADRQKVGDVCSRSAELLLFSECETGDACVADPGGCEGKCVARALLTQSCGIDTPCVAGASCSTLGGGTCELKAGMGGKCGLDWVPCQTGLYCTDLENGGTCLPQKGLGGACPTHDACQGPAFCDGANFVDGGICRMVPRPGIACDPLYLLSTCDFDGSARILLKGSLYCGDDMKCHPSPGVGQSCETPAGTLLPCAAGFCDKLLANPVCKVAPTGHTCIHETDCAPHALCAYGYVCTEVCVPR